MMAPPRLTCRLILGLTALALAGCVGTGGYVDDGYGTGFYGAESANFAGWGPGYAVGPFHDDRLLDGEVGPRFAHRWRFARGARGIPFIPGGRGHGFHGGGFRGGGHAR